MHEVEGQVGRRRAALVDSCLGLREQRAGRGFRLHEPAKVEAELGLREEDRPLLRRVQKAHARQRGGVVPQHVPEGEVVVVDGRARLVAEVGRMLGAHGRQQCRDLHHVVHCHQGEHRHRARHVDDEHVAGSTTGSAAGSAAGPYEEAGIADQLLHPSPVASLPQLEALLVGAQRPVALGRRRRRLCVHPLSGRWCPAAAEHAKAKAALPVEALRAGHLRQREAHEPVDVEESAAHAAGRHRAATGQSPGSRKAQGSHRAVTGQQSSASDGRSRNRTKSAPEWCAERRVRRGESGGGKASQGRAGDACERHSNERHDKRGHDSNAVPAMSPAGRVQPRGEKATCRRGEVERDQPSVIG